MSLVPRFIYGDLDLTEWPFAIEFGSDFGNPENVVEVVASMLADGEVLEVNRRTNRTLTIPVLCDEADLQALALAEQLLIAEADKPRNTLTIDPGDGFAPPTVFDTFRAQPRWVRNDNEEQHGVRRISLEIPALPHGRSVDKFVDVATSPPGVDSGTVFNACESTTDWSGFGSQPTPTFAVDSTIYVEGTGSIKSQVTGWFAGAPGGTESNGAGGTQSFFYPASGSSDHQLSGLSLDTGTGGYLSAAIRIDSAYSGSKLQKIYQSTTPGVWTEVPSWASVKVSPNGFVYYRWPVEAGKTILGLRFSITYTVGGPNFGYPAPFVWYDDFRILPTASTDQQIVKQLEVEGSARTTGSLHIGSGIESVALGRVLVMTMPTESVPVGFNPEGRPWVSQGSVTSDMTALAGSYYSPDATAYSSAAGKPIFDVPVRLLNAGAYTIVALVKTASGTLVTGVRAQLNVGGTLVGTTSEAEIAKPNTFTGWQFVTVGTVYLPPVPVQGADPTTSVRLLFKGASMANVYMIPAWRDGGRAVADYSIVDCGSGAASAAGPSSHLWIDSPSTDQPRGGWWRGPTDDRLNTRSAWADARRPGIHSFSPGRLSAFLVSTDAFGPTLELEYFPNWFGNAAI